MGSEHARFAILVSIRRFLGMGNSLGPFPDTSDWPKWPKWAFSVTYGLSNDHKMAKLVTLVLSMLETWFGCLFPGFVAWELLHTHTSYSDWPTWPKWPFMATQMTIKWINYNFGSEHARNVILVSIPRFCGMGNSLGPFSDTSDWPKWPKWPFSAIYGHWNGQIGNYVSKYARNVFLVSIPRLLGIGRISRTLATWYNHF